MIDDAYRLDPSGQPVGCLLGTLLPHNPGVLGTILLTSPIAHRDFDEQDRSDLEKFVPLRPWTELVGSMVEIGGSEADLEAWVDSGLIIRFPGSVTISAFEEVFRGIALVSTTALAVGLMTDDVVELKVPDSDDTLPVSRLFFEALRRSTGKDDLPSILKAACDGNLEAEHALVGEVIATLRFLVSNRVAAVMRAQ